ncbi:udp-glucose 4-epimerase [Holotrichia oblita]|nr:udp-glucose 4-epimerase [Holotrichia oblita]
MAILVCGGAGYIGSHTVAELIEQGRQVVVVDNLEKGHRGAVDSQATFYEGDKRDMDFMDHVFAENQISAVIDFAAYSLVGESVGRPLDYYDNNVYGAMCLLKSMLKNNVRHIVFSSTAATYGEPENIPILETDATVPTNPYGESKLAIEKMLKWCDSAYGINVNEIIECARKVTGKEIPVTIDKRRAGDPSSLVASSEKIVKELGWSPKYNSLEQIIQSAWLWHKEHREGYND